MDNEKIDKLFRDKLKNFEAPQKGWENLTQQLDLQKSNARRLVHKRIIQALSGLTLITGISIAIWFSNQENKTLLNQTAINFKSNLVFVKIDKKESIVEPEEQEEIVLTKFENANLKENETTPLEVLKGEVEKEKIILKTDTTKPKETKQEIFSANQFLEEENGFGKIESNEAEAEEGQKIIVTVKLSPPNNEGDKKSFKEKVLSIKSDKKKKKTRFGKFLRAFNRMRKGKEYNDKDLRIFKQKKKNDK